MSDVVPNLYETLGIADSAGADESQLNPSCLSTPLVTYFPPVRKAYKQKVLETHPDKLGPDATPEEKQKAHEEFGKVRIKCT
jgi:hypothetical protein